MDNEQRSGGVRMGKERARLMILHYVMELSLSRTFGDGKTYGGLISCAFMAGGSRRDVSPGDLIALQSAPVSKFYLGWLLETREAEHGWPEYLLESIEDGSQCWWHNVGVMYMNRETVAEHPEWRWDDRQHAFNDRWKRACFRQRDAYIYLPMMAEFDGLRVKLGVRVRHNLSAEREYKTFDDWRKVRVSDMLEFYDQAEEALKQDPHGRDTGQGSTD